MNGYQPYFFNQHTQIQQTTNSQASNLNWIDVNSINDINNISVQPNSTAWIRFINEPIIACKTSDGIGICTTKYFKIEPIELNQQQNNINTDNFVTKQDLQNFMEELNSKLDTIKKTNNINNNPNNNVNK